MAAWLHDVNTQANKKVQAMLTLEQIREELKPYNLTRVAKETGINRHTLYRLMHESHRPSYDTVKTLSDYLSGEDE